MTVHSVLVLLNYISVIILLGCCALIATHAESRMQKLALLVGISLLVSSLGFLFRIEAKNADAFIVGQKLLYAFVTHAMFFMLLFILDYCRFSIPKALQWVFHGINSLLSLAVITLDHHDLFYRSYWAVDMGGYCVLEKEYGPLHTVVVVLFGLYMAVAVVTAVVFALRNLHQRSRYVLQLLVAVSLPCLAYIIPKLADINTDLQPIAFAAFMVLVLVMIYRNGLYDVNNIAARYALDSMKEAVVVFDARDRFKGCNSRAEELFPILRTLCLDCELPGEASALRELLSGKITELNQEGAVYGASAEPIVSGGRALGRVLRLEDVTFQRQYTALLEQQKQQLEGKVMTLEDLSYHDQLTGLANRRCYEEMVSLCRTQKDIRSLTIVALDLNGLKNVNDTIGHAAGDELIRGAAQVISQALEPWGQTYRTGGDEFFGILTKPLPQVEALTRRLDEGMAGWKGSLVSALSFAYGVVRGSEHPSSTIDDLMILADRAMYDRKREYHEKTENDRRKG